MASEPFLLERLRLYKAKLGKALYEPHIVYAIKSYEDELMKVRK